MNSLVGKQIDQYDIVRAVARGGMAEVYLATDVTLQRQVALKVMLSELAKDQTAMARFRREAEAVARLNHPNIIQIYTTGMTPDKRPYLAMQYVSGGTLQQQLAQLARQGQQMSVADSLSLARQVALAMQVAHQHDIVHRDLKPSNILLRSDGEPVLTDLGIAALDTQSTRLTQTGSIMGTPHYMSPEQALGRHVDGRSDIYSLGIILYELLTGHVPFAEGSPLAVLHQHVHEPPRPLEQVRPGLSQTTYRTVNTCLQKEPDRRFQTSGQLVTALDHSLINEGLKTPQAVSAYPTEKIPEQHRRWPIYALAVLVVLIIATTVGWLVLTAEEPNSQVAEEDPSPVPAVVMATTTRPVEVTATIVPTGTTPYDPGCSMAQENVAYIGENGDVCFGGMKILDMVEEGGGCFGVGGISPAPTIEYFAVLLQCFEGDNEAYIFRSDGSNKQRLTGEWDYINYDQYVWTTDEYFVYQRINSCCAEAPADAPQLGAVWYDPETSQKLMHDSPSPLEQYHVLGVASDDSLNVRSAAGIGNPIVGSIPFNGTDIEVTGLGVDKDGGLWVPIRYQELSGWVNNEFIQAEGSEPVPGPIDPPLVTSDVSAVFLASPPTIDGSLADWPGSPSYLSAFLVHQDDVWDGSDDIEAIWQLGWDYSNLYMAVTVVDDVHVQIKSDTKNWQGDSAEIQFDTDLDGDYGTSLNSDDFQLNVSPGDFRFVPSAHHFWRAGADGGYEWIRENSIVLAARDQGEEGYILEMAIPWTELNMRPLPGLRIGIALNVTDNDTAGTAVQEVMKSSSKERDFTHPDSWGTLTLQE